LSIVAVRRVDALMTIMQATVLGFLCSCFDFQFSHLYRFTLSLCDTFTC